MAWQGSAWHASAPNHTRIDCELRQGGKIIFARGDTWCATPGCVDDDEAKELVMSLFAMRPGDTDPEYFASYTAEQLAWVERNGEELGVEREYRYCDPETGGVRRTA